MSGVYGSAFDAADATLAPGTVVDAGLRRHRNVFNFADAGVGGAIATLIAAKAREGNALQSIELHASVDVSAINISAGITGSTAKYVAATAGPNATTKRLVVKSTALDDDALSAPETLILTPSGNWPATGILIVDAFYSKR
jgi:hypothetical protein